MTESETPTDVRTVQLVFAALIALYGILVSITYTYIGPEHAQVVGALLGAPILILIALRVHLALHDRVIA